MRFIFNPLLFFHLTPILPPPPSDPLRFANYLLCCFNVTFYLYRHDAKMVVVKGGKAELKKSKPGAVEEGNSSEKHAPPLIHPLNGILYCKIVGTLQICHVRA